MRLNFYTYENREEGNDDHDDTRPSGCEPSEPSSDHLE